MLNRLRSQIYEEESLGRRIKSAEVGPKTWKYLIDIVEQGSGRKIPPEIRHTIKEGWFLGIKIRPNENVPEEVFWPLE